METSSKRHAWFHRALAKAWLFAVIEFEPSPLLWDLHLLCGLALARRWHLILEVFSFTLLSNSHINLQLNRLQHPRWHDCPAGPPKLGTNSWQCFHPNFRLHRSRTWSFPTNSRNCYRVYSTRRNGTQSSFQHLTNREMPQYASPKCVYRDKRQFVKSSSPLWLVPHHQIFRVELTSYF